MPPAEVRGGAVSAVLQNGIVRFALWCGRATQDDLEHAIRTCAPRQAMVAWDEIRRRARLAR